MNLLYVQYIYTAFLERILLYSYTHLDVDIQPQNSELRFTSFGRGCLEFIHPNRKPCLLSAHGHMADRVHPSSQAIPRGQNRVFVD